MTTHPVPGSRVPVFISYSRQDEQTARRLEELLYSHGCDVWRDKVSLYGGDHWPAKLGEAIAGAQSVLLLWSASAAGSHWVEFEWSTALALRKRIVLCKLDSTRLPPSLAATEAVKPDQANRIVDAVRQPSATISDSGRAPVLRALDTLDQPTPLQAVNTVKPLIESSVLAGGVNVAGRDVNIFHFGGPALVALLIAAGVLFFWLSRTDLLHTTGAATGSTGEAPRERVFNLGGTVYDHAGNPLSGVAVMLPEFGSQTITNDLGRFDFQLKSRDQTHIKVIAKKDGFETSHLDPTLGDTGLNLILTRSR